MSVVSYFRNVRHGSLILSHSHTGSYDFWIVRLVAMGPRCDRSAMFATIFSSGRIPRSICTCGRAFKNDWRISMAIPIVGYRATSGSYQRSMFGQSGPPATCATSNRSLHHAIDRTSNRGMLWPIVRALVASCYRVYAQSWHPKTDGTINREGQRSIERSIVASCDRSYDQ